MTKNLPIGKPKYIDDFTDINVDQLYGFFKVHVIAPKNIYMPILPLRNENKIISPIGEWTYTYFNEEIINAKKYGYKFEYVEGYIYEKGKLLKEFVYDLYEQRKKYDKNNPMNLVLKLLLNSLYGRFGMKILSSKKKIINYSEIKSFLKKYRVIDLEVYDEKTCLIEYEIESTISKKKLTIKDKLEDYNVNTAVHIASAITSYSRIYMCKLLNDKVYYTDTDSIFTTEKLNKEFISNKLGDMKLENKIIKAIFIAPKVYYYITNDHKKILKFKGNNENNINTKILHNKLYENNKESYNWTQKTFFRKNYKNFTINFDETNIKNNLNSDKREKIYKKGK